MVSAWSSARLVNFATPRETATCGSLQGPEPLVRPAVTIELLSVVSTLPKASSSSMTGWVAKATPAVALAEGGDEHELAGCRRVDRDGPEATAGRPPPVNFSAMVSALSLTRC